LELSFSREGNPSTGLPVDIVVSKKVKDGRNRPLRRHLDDDGRLSEIVEYPESMIDVVLGLTEHDSKAPLRSTYHWYQPGQWFEGLLVEDDISCWKCTTQRDNSDYVAQLNYPENAVPLTASVRFGNLLGIGFSACDEKWTEASASFHEDRIVKITFHMKEYFEKWLDNMAEYPTSGDSYPISSTFTFKRRYKSEISDRDDPGFEAFEYDGLVDGQDGNPFLEIPSLEPEEQVLAVARRNVAVTDTMLSGTS
jgi:hypothetical protein